MAVEELFEIKSVTHRPNLIIFSWADIGGQYKVFRDGELLYEGTVPEFKDGHFHQAKMYSYSIERLIDNEVVDVIALQTSAYAEERNAENPLQFLVMTTIVAKTQIALSWEEIEDVEEYEIYRNEVFMKKVKVNAFVDRDFSLDESYIYRIYYKRSIEKSEEIMSAGKSLISGVMGIFKRSESDDKPVMEHFTVSKFIANPRKLLTPVTEKTNHSNVNKWRLRYTTFLQEEIVENPNKLSGFHYFKGDNRGFNPEGESFRTRVTVDLDYSSKEASLDLLKEVGETVGYDSSMKVREKDTASDEDILLERLEHEKGEVGFLLTHSVGNPLVVTPNIDYDLQAVLRKNGTFDVTGFHDQAPHHEVYLNQDNHWFSIHQTESEGLMWMSGVTGSQYWRASNFH